MKTITQELIEKHIKEIEVRNYEAIVYEALSRGVFGDLINILNDAEIIEDEELIVLAEKNKPPRAFKIDTAALPEYLRTAHFAVWTKKFNQLIKKIGLDEWDFSEPTIPIKFSNKEETKNYGMISLNEAKSEIRKRWRLNESAEEILSRIHDIDTYHKEPLSSPLAEVIYASNREYSYAEIKQIIDELFGRVCFTTRILGEYRHSERTIVLYTKNVEITSKGDRTLEQSFELTFVHELFHAYHYLKGEKELVKRNDYTASVVKESLASAFEWFYCVESEIESADELKSSWYKHSVLTYPYSGAQHLIDSNANKLQCAHFCEIFSESLNDTDKALLNFLTYS